MRTTVGVAFGFAFALAGGGARADLLRGLDRLQGGTTLHYELTGLEAIDTTTRAEGEAPRARELILAGVRLHGFFATGSTVNYATGLALAAGATIDGRGFAYDVALFPVGVAVRSGRRTAFVSLSTGVGAIGATGTIDDAVTVPLEAAAECNLGRRLRVLARARVAYVAGADARQSSAPSVPFADELDATVGLRLGHAYDEYGFPTGNGYFVGASYRELAGVRFAGITIGYTIDAATARRVTR